MGGIGATEILLLVLVALLLFGAGRIADIGRGLGEGIRNFKKGLRDDGLPPADRLAGGAAPKSLGTDPKDAPAEPLEPAPKPSGAEE